MRGLTAAEILDGWGAGRGLGPTRRALALLASAGAGDDVDRLAALPLGERDRLLLELRERTFGRPLDCRTACPQCGEELEASIETAALRGQDEEAVEGEDRRLGAGAEVAIGDLAVRLRPLTSADLLAVEGLSDFDGASRELARRSCRGLARAGAPVDVADLSAAELSALADHLAELDPGAEILLGLACAGCGHVWREPLDVASFFAAELDQAARELLAEVHLLAAAYGWREGDILALPAARRAAYLALIGGEGVA